MSDVSFVITWWFTILIVGITAFPLTSWLFKNFIDKGYIFSKIVGILVISYIVWLLASFHLVPFTKMTIIILIIGINLINLWLRYGKKSDESHQGLPLKWIIFEEIIFLLALSFWSYVRANEPSIRGLEKFMDFGFVNSIIRANYFPPLDMWLTKSPDYTGGYFINYYYFGHYVTALLTKLSGIDAAVTYNLMMATLFAFTFSLPFSLGANFTYFFYKTVKSHLKIAIQPHLLVGVGLLCAFLVALGGNLHTLYSFTSGYPNEEPQEFWKLSLGFYPDRYWYPNATRFIPYTIHEFPIYSFVVADLHGHVSDIPFVLLGLAFLLSLFIDKKDKESHVYKLSFLPEKVRGFMEDFENHTSIPFIKIVLLGILLSIMYMTNAWDGLIYLMLSVIVFLYLNFSKQYRHPDISASGAIYKTASASLFLIFFFLIANFPFTANFKPFVSGIGFLCSPQFLLNKKIGPLVFEPERCQKSPIWMMAVLWGFFYYNVIGFFYFAILPSIKEAKQSIIVKKLSRYLHSFIHTLNPIDMFALILIFLSTFLLIFPEFFYIRDIYPIHYRANTMFKLGYQSFMMLGLVSGYSLFRIRYSLAFKRSLLKILYNTIFILLFALVAIYPYFAIISYYGKLSTYNGLFGLNWLSTTFPDDFQAVEWLRNNVVCRSGTPADCNNQPVIVEANGESYTDYARVSANTGLPTIIGWPVHEWLWRGSYDEAGKRIPEVEAIYQSENIDEVTDILKKYKAEYIFVGSLEREKYPKLTENTISKLAHVVFESGDTRIYKVSSFSP